MKKSYLEKYKDPRWQKKRLEILERDKWSCKRCTRLDAPLHVHHRIYISGKDPWDYENNLLVTLCEDCHEYETETRKAYENDLLKVLREVGFFADDLYSIICGFLNLSSNLNNEHSIQDISKAVELALGDKKLISNIPS